MVNNVHKSKTIDKIINIFNFDTLNNENFTFRTQMLVQKLKSCNRNLYLSQSMKKYCKNLHTQKIENYPH